jgi:DsbC/DsbD-like thiol-disulfide interchange protein
MSNLLALVLFLSCLPCAVRAMGPAVTAGVELVSQSVEAGGSLPVLVRLRVPAGWHIYWRNSGEAGMATRFVWTLPPGWKAEGPAFPVPERFESGGIVGFGYSGDVEFPATLLAPAGFVGTTEPRLRVEWLACNDKGCVPGHADLCLGIRAGKRADGPTKDAWLAAQKRVPVSAAAATRLQVAEEGRLLRLALQGPHDPTGRQVFAATPQVIDDKDPVVFRKSGGMWIADVGRNEYADGPPRLLELVFSASAAAGPFSVVWSSGPGK